jgi:hypothetical protein
MKICLSVYNTPGKSISPKFCLTIDIIVGTLESELRRSAIKIDRINFQDHLTENIV